MFKKQAVYLLSIVFIFNVLEANSFRSNNACKNYIEYFFADFSKNCYYNPDVYSSNTDILARYVSTYESHTVTTDDGYILTLFRIPKENPKGVVILQHPVLSDSISFIAQGNRSLAFLMANQGYDVWIPNQRGTYYSDKHINHTISDTAYWNFSFHEIGLNDYSSIIRYVKGKTKRSDLIFIGHSMSVTASVIYASLKPTEAKSSIKIFIEMAPPVFVKNVRSPVKIIVPPIVKIIRRVLHINSLFKKGSPEYYLSRMAIYFPFKIVLVIFNAVFSGWTPREMDPELINVLFGQHPRPFSTKILSHYAQLADAGGTKFLMYDYGKKENKLMYGSKYPPEYPIEKINVPMYLIPSASDAVATVKDTEILYKKLPKAAKVYGKLEVTGFGHTDFFFGKHAVEKIYEPIFSLLDKIF